MTQPNVWKFLQELVLRFGSKNPKFFNVLAWIGAVATFITGLPVIFEQLGIVLPDAWQALQSKIIAGAGFAIMIISNLPVAPEPVAPANQLLPDAKPGDVLGVTRSEKMPYSVAVEQKKIDVQAATADELVPPKVTTDSTKPPTQ
jgi:hypothetical protein